MHGLDKLLDQDEQKQAMRDTRLTEEQFRTILEAAVEIFREDPVRNIFPTDVKDDPGVLQARRADLEDMGEAQHGMSGTGGTFDRIDFSFTDEPAYPIFHNGHIPWRVFQSARRVTQLNLLEQTGEALGEKVREKENEMLISGLGPVTGFEQVTGHTSFTGGNWANDGEAWNDLTRAVDEELKDNDAPTSQAALLVAPQERARLRRVFSSTDTAQENALSDILPGGVHSHKRVTDGTAWVFARTPTVVEYEIYQNLTTVPLPRLDEDERTRLRTIGAFHLKKAEGIIELQNVDA